MDFNYFFTKYKKGLIIIGATLIIGTIFGFTSKISKKEFNKLVNDRKAASNNIDNIKSEISKQTKKLNEIEDQIKDIEKNIN